MEKKKILDLGCFAGSFLKQLDGDKFPVQVGVDILKNQIDYANKFHGRDYRRFYHINDFNDITKHVKDEDFDFVTLIEVIEHLTHEQIQILFQNVARVLKPGGKLILTTPNYLSIWPLLEFILNRFSDVNYEEQHITKFHFFNFKRKLQEIYPEFDQHFHLEFKTTTHFITPFTAQINYKWSQKISEKVTPDSWPFPAGPLILAKIVKK